MNSDFNPITRFAQQARSEPDRPALWHGEQLLSYGELAATASAVAGWLRDQGAQRVAVVGGRSAAQVAGLLGATWAGCTWVPVDSRQPAARVASVIERARPDALIVDADGAANRGVAEDSECPRLQLIASSGESSARLCEISEISTLEALNRPTPMTPEHPVYIMFTSGTTGVPKGVVIGAEAFGHYLDVLQSSYPLEPADRVALYSQLTFDLSLFDVFSSLGAGACIYLIPESQRMAPGRFIASHELSVILLGPSTGAMMARVGQLRPGALPSLRLSIFAGEALPVALVERWRSAAPQSEVVNGYGPTETTLTCLFTPCREDTVETPGRGWMTLGKPHPGMHAAVVDRGGAFLARGETGELAICGPQLAIGYWCDEHNTADRFRTLSHPELGAGRWYLTGDQAFEDEAGDFHFLSRIDHQIKVRGHRLELEEVEAHMRAVCQAERAAAAAWPIEEGAAKGLVGFVEHCSLGPSEIIAALRERLPAHAVPRRIIELETLPLTRNAKLDRVALRAMLEAEA